MNYFNFENPDDIVSEYSNNQEWFVGRCIESFDIEGVVCQFESFINEEEETDEVIVDVIGSIEDALRLIGYSDDDIDDDLYTYTMVDFFEECAWDYYRIVSDELNKLLQEDFDITNVYFEFGWNEDEWVLYLKRYN